MVDPMRVSDEGKIGIGLALFGLLGAGGVIVTPAPWLADTAWAMIGIAVAGLLLLLTHFLYERIKVHREKKRKAAETGPSKDDLRLLHERIEELMRLEIDGARFEKDENKVNYETFHEVTAVAVTLTKNGIDNPFIPKYKDLTNYENFNFVMYRYLAAVSPHLREGDIKAVRHFATCALEQLSAKEERPAA
jgi:hypothetical protein